MLYPKGTKFGNYFLQAEAPGRFTIRRQITLPDGTRSQPRHPKKLYAHLTTENELQQYLNRLNHRQDQKARLALEIRTSFIPQALMDEFRDQLKLEIPNPKDFRYQYSRVFQSYFLKFFIHTLNVVDPNQWYQHQSQWGAALLGHAENPEHNLFKKKMSFKTISKTIQIANRFMRLIHLKNPAEFQRIVFDPISRGAQNAYTGEIERQKGDASDVGKFITPEDWTKIQKGLPADIRPFIELAYAYGLRRGETMGFENMESVKKGYLKVSQQLVGIGFDKACRYGALKSRAKRETPHWFATPHETYNHIKDGLERKMHPDTLYVRWNQYMISLGMDYALHDLRRTFITRALREYNPRDVQLAVGHVSLSTTMLYAMDDRDHSDDTFEPSAS